MNKLLLTYNNPRRRYLYQFFLVISLIIGSLDAYSQVADCDRLAASPMDIEKNNPGLSFNAINAPLAIAACKQAVDLNPNSGRLWFQYGRALEKGNLLPDSIVAYQRAGSLNHAAALNNLGELYRDGKGFQQDLNKARDYFARSANLGSPEGGANLKKINGSMGGVQNNVMNQGFRMPSGRIVCMADGSGIRCDFSADTLSFPLSSSSCPMGGNYGDAFYLQQNGKAGPQCHTDTILGESLPTLSYGSTWTNNNITCTSQSTGLTCKNSLGHGFSINKTSQKIF
jgi:TPR repeat protein